MNAIKIKAVRVISIDSENLAADPKFLKKNNSEYSDFFGMLLNLMWIGIVSKSPIMVVYVPIHPEKGLIAENDFSRNKGQSAIVSETVQRAHSYISHQSHQKLGFEV